MYPRKCRRNVGGERKDVQRRTPIALRSGGSKKKKCCGGVVNSDEHPALLLVYIHEPVTDTPDRSDMNRPIGSSAPSFSTTTLSISSFFTESTMMATPGFLRTRRMNSVPERSGSTRPRMMRMGSNDLAAARPVDASSAT